MKRAFLTIVFLASALAVFAFGAGEETEFNGTITGIEPTESAEVVVTIVTPDGESYSMNLDAEVIAALGVELGSELVVEGDVDDDGTEIEVEWITTEGREVEVEIVDGEIVSIKSEFDDDDDDDSDDDDSDDDDSDDADDDDSEDDDSEDDDSDDDDEEDDDEDDEDDE